MKRPRVPAKTMNTEASLSKPLVMGKKGKKKRKTKVKRRKRKRWKAKLG